MTREKLLNQIAAYIPYNEQEAADRELNPALDTGPR